MKQKAINGGDIPPSSEDTGGEIIEKIINKYLWRATWGASQIPFLSTARARICSVGVETVYYECKIFHSYSKFYIPVWLWGGGLIYSGDGKEPGRRLGEIRKGCAAKLTGACQKLQLIIETVADAAILAGVSATREEYDC